MSTDTVRVYDFKTKQITTIPARELAPGMIRATVQGIEGEVWIDSKELKAGWYQHPPFGEEIRSRIARLSHVFHDVYPCTPDKWEDGFRRDHNAEREIAIWLRMADVFEHFTEGQQLSYEQRKDIFDVILTAVNNGKDRVLLTLNPLTLSKQRVKEIVNLLFPAKSGPEPSTG